MVGQRGNFSSLWVVRIQEPEQGRTRAGRWGPGSGQKRGCTASGLTGGQAGLAKAPRPTRLPSPFHCPPCCTAFGAILQGSLFGLAGLLPASYTAPIMSGQGLAGFFASVAMICAIASKSCHLSACHPGGCGEEGTGLASDR